VTTLARFQTYDDVVAGLATLESRFQQANDRRCVFASLYGVVSSALRDRVRAGAFADTEWVHRYGVAFANLYLDALEHDEAGRSSAVPSAWRLCFAAARRSDGLVLQDMLLGVNAHINHDLPFALRQVSIDPDRDRRYQDHAAVNAVLASVVEKATTRLAELYAPGLATMDECAGQLDEWLSLFSIEVARDSAWESAVALANARTDLERGLAASLIGSRAALMARLLLAPTLNPAAVSACRRLEQGLRWPF